MSAQLQEMNDLMPERQSVDIKVRLTQLLDFSKRLEVVDEFGFRQIMALYSESKGWEKKIEFLRTEANGPDQERINARNDKAKELLKPLKEIQSVAKTKSAQYQAILEERKRQEEKRIEDILDIIGVDEMPYIEPIEKSVRTEKGMMYTKVVKKFRIVDRDKIPACYLMVNEKAVENGIKLGIANIPGIEIYEEETTQLRTR